MTETALDIEQLKDKADLLGVKYHSNISAPKLSAKIAEHVAAQEAGEEKAKAPAKKSKTKAQQAVAKKKELGVLTRIRLTCLNPNKRDWPGELISAGNAQVGFFKKYVPFDAEDGWHVPTPILNVLKGRKFRKAVKIKGLNGTMTQKQTMVPEFAIEILPPLTEEELAELAAAQAAGRNID